MYNILGESTLDLDIKDTVNQLSKRVSAINEKMYEFEQTKVNVLNFKKKQFLNNF